MNPWDREDTRTWIAQLSNRLEDVEYYKNQTLEWCKSNDVVSETLVTKCLIATCIWVSNMRLEPISLGEIYDFLGIPEDIYLKQTTDRDMNDTIEFSQALNSVELEVILKGIVEEGV
jgi:hypothetical protein